MFSGPIPNWKAALPLRYMPLSWQAWWASLPVQYQGLDCYLQQNTAGRFSVLVSCDIYYPFRKLSCLCLWSYIIFKVGGYLSSLRCCFDLEILWILLLLMCLKDLSWMMIIWSILFCKWLISWKIGISEPLREYIIYFE